VTFIIGGPYGVTQELRDRSNFVWSLGKLVMPYEIVRLVLVEQIYRSQCINSNHPYHHI
jgi:23S rRNA (pseudouridine1915-N3)-methyltransferase